jgi:hypothetical protein
MPWIWDCSTGTVATRFGSWGCFDRHCCGGQRRRESGWGGCIDAVRTFTAEIHAAFSTMLNWRHSLRTLGFVHSAAYAG